jgi:hypothetical protein
VIDDLVPLLGGKDPQDFGFRQGTVVSFNVYSGVGDVRVGGTVLTDVPFLSQAGQVSYMPGDAVLLVRLRSSWAIIGRFVSPGGTRAIGRYFELTGVAGQPAATNFALTTTFATVTTLNIAVPAWAEVATVTTSLMLWVNNPTASDDFLYGQILLPGGLFTNWVSPNAPTGKFTSLTVVGHQQLLVTPGGTLTLQGQARSGAAAWAANASNTAYLQATVAWNSNDG